VRPRHRDRRPEPVAVAHARFGVDSTGFWVEDRGSVNGTSVVHADGSSVKVGAGEWLTVPVGGSVRLGELTFTVRPLA